MQKIILFAWTWLLLLSGMTPAAIQPAYFSISYMAEAPTINGVIDRDEWKSAGAITGGALPGSNRIASNQAAFWLGWDEANLYLAMRSYFRPGIRPDFVVGIMTDNLELGFFPVIANLDGPRRIFINGNARWDDPATGHWNINLKTADRTYVDPNDTYGFGTTVWELEARLPAEDFSLPRQNRAGDEWRLLLVRNFLHPWMQVNIPVSHGFLNPEGYVRATLTRNQPAVQFLNVLPLLQGRASIKVQIHNPTDDPVTLAVDLAVDNTRERISLFKQTQNVEVGPGETTLWQPDAALGKLEPGDLAAVELSVRGADGTAYLSYTAMFTLDKQLMQIRNGVRTSILPEIECLAYSRFPSGLFVDRGKGATKVTYRSGSYSMPRLSSDLKRVLFTSYEGAERAVWLVDTGERRPVMLARGEQASWLPGDKEFVFVLDGAIYRQRIGSNDRRRLTPPKLGSCRFPSVSADGRHLVLVAGDGDSVGLYVMSLDTVAPKQVTTGEILSPPSWSPDGRHIAFQDGPRVYITDLAGNRRLLVAEGGVQAYPVWSIDGNGVAFCQGDSPDGPWQLRAIDVAGAGDTALLERRVDAGADVRWRCKPVEEEPPPPTVTCRSKGGKAELVVDGKPALALLGIADAAKIETRPRGIRVARQNDAIRIVGDFEALIIPDRLGDDIVIREAPENLNLSHTPLLIGVLRDGNGLVVLAVPAENREITVGGGDTLTLSVSSGSGPLGAGIVLEGWPSELPGQWRLVVPRRQSARMVSGTAETVQKVIAEKYPGVGPHDVTCYLFGRRGNTPRSVWSVTDVVMDLIGIEQGRRVLMQKEVTTIKVSRQHVSYPTVELTTEAITMAYGGYNFVRWAPDDIKHWLDDVVYLLRAEDGRLDEYAAFADAARRVIGRPKAAPQEQIGEMRESLDGLVETLRKREGFPLCDEVAAAAQALAKKGAGQLKAFNEVAKQAADQRSETLQQCRQQVRALRNGVARQLLRADNARRPAALQLYQLTASVLADRQYAENDWRGESVDKPYARPWWGDIW